jgi:hypothetical protein
MAYSPRLRLWRRSTSRPSRGAEMACRTVVVVWLASGTTISIGIGIGIGNSSSGISGMIIGRRGRVVSLVWRVGVGSLGLGSFANQQLHAIAISACGALGSPAAVADQKKSARMKGHERRRYELLLRIRAPVQFAGGGLRVERAEHVFTLLLPCSPCQRLTRRHSNARAQCLSPALVCRATLRNRRGYVAL